MSAVKAKGQSVSGWLPSVVSTLLISHKSLERLLRQSFLEMRNIYDTVVQIEALCKE